MKKFFGSILVISLIVSLSSVNAFSAEPANVQEVKDLTKSIELTTKRVKDLTQEMRRTLAQIRAGEKSPKKVHTVKPAVIPAEN